MEAPRASVMAPESVTGLGGAMGLTTGWLDASVTKSREDDQMTETTKRIAVSVSHTYTASPERVFDAWVDPKKAVKFFFATETGEVVRCEIDARVGGTFTVVDRRDGKDVLHTGKYIEVERPRHLVFDFAVPDYSPEWTRVSIDITPSGSGSQLTLTHDGVFEEYAVQTQNGWTTILAALDKVVTA